MSDFGNTQFPIAVLLLAKIFDFASMFVCRFVCLSVCKSLDTGHSFQPIFTKFGGHMYSGPRHKCIVFGVDDVIDDVIRSKKHINFKIAITPSFFKLEQKFKNWNVVLCRAHLSVPLNFRYHFRFKSSPEVKFRKWKFQISIFASFYARSNLITYFNFLDQN